MSKKLGILLLVACLLISMPVIQAFAADCTVDGSALDPYCSERVSSISSSMGNCGTLGCAIYTTKMSTDGICREVGHTRKNIGTHVEEYSHTACGKWIIDCPF